MRYYDYFLEMETLSVIYVYDSDGALATTYRYDAGHSDPIQIQYFNGDELDSVQHLSNRVVTATQVFTKVFY